MQRQLDLSKHSPAYDRIFYPCPSVSSVVQNLSHHALGVAGPSARRLSDVFSQSLASSLVEGFENATPVWLVEAQPCVPLPSALSVSIRVIRRSFSLPYERLYQPLINREMGTPIQVFAQGLAIYIQRRGQLSQGTETREASKRFS